MKRIGPNTKNDRFIASDNRTKFICQPPCRATCFTLMMTDAVAVVRFMSHMMRLL